MTETVALSPLPPRVVRSRSRRAVSRWAVRLFRMDWRTQLWVIALIGLATAAATGIGAAAYGLMPGPVHAEFGTAAFVLEFRGLRSEAVDAVLDGASERFGTIDVVLRGAADVPGRFEPIELRYQVPDGPYAAPLLALMDGRFPTEFGEIAITDGIEEEFSLSIGDSAVFDGTELTVVGIVENPSDFSDEFVFVDPAATASLGMVSIFVDADEDLVESFRPDGGGSLSISGHGGVNEATVAAIGVLGIATVGLLFVALLSAAGYAVVAQRRQQQLGLFASIGATERQVRSVMVTNGYIAGTVATVTGAGIGLVAWLAAQGPLESAVGYRVPTFSIPWWLVGTLIVIGIGSSTFAAWWPSRAVSRTSVVRALSGRPTAPRSVHRSVAVSGFLIAAGVVSMAVAGDLGDDRTIRWVNVALVLGGTVAVTVGLLLASPLAIRLTAVAASHVRVGPRIALRDLARYQSRSAAALAAILLGLGIAVAILIASTAAQYTAETGNLAVDQIMIRATHFGGPFVPTANEVSDLDASVSEVADALDANAVTPLLVAADARVENDTVFPGRIAISLAIRVEDGWSDLSLLYVATPELMARLGDVGGDVDQSSGLAVAADDDELALLGVSTPSAPSGGRPTVAEWSAFVPKYTSLPAAISSVDHLEAKDWAAIPSGQWLVDVDTVSPETLSDAKDLAAAAGLTIEVRDSQGGLGAMRAIATTVGMLVALGVIAAMVALIRGETTKDHETLTETGAPAGVRRSIVATTAATFAILGVLLGGAAAAVIVTVGYIDDLSILTRLPVGYVLAIAIGTPVIAGLGGWITGGGDVSRPRSFGDLA